MDIQGITIEVSDLARSKKFYEELLGFTAGEYYEPTKWQPYIFGKQFFAIRGATTMRKRDDFDITNFSVANVAELWEKLKDKVEVVEPLATTPWGSYKFVVKDPDGYRIGIVQAVKASPKKV